MPSRRGRLLLLLPDGSYRNDDFLDAAKRLNLDVIQAQNHCGPLSRHWGRDELVALDFSDPAAAAETVREALAGSPPDAVIGVDDAGVEAAAAIASALGLRANSPAAVSRLRNKAMFRRLQAESGLPHPGFRLLEPDDDSSAAAPVLNFPLVVKPLRLSGSRGVMRVDSAAQLAQAVERAREILRRANTRLRERQLLLEDFLPGREVALEGLLHEGRLRVLAVFDKPDPLDGPCFAETIYVTPSSLPGTLQEELQIQVEKACAAAGLHRGPVHAEARIHNDSVTLLEVAPRTIGGLCARTLRHRIGMSLEELVIRDAMGLVATGGPVDPRPSGVMMIPVPRSGVLRAVDGVEAARTVAGIEEVIITAHAGEVLVPLPDDSVYVGFLFARGDSVREVEQALRRAFGFLRIELQDLLVSEAG
jgi:biotin carboxylase